MILLDTSAIIKLIHNKLDLAKLKLLMDESVLFGISSISMYELHFGLYQLKYSKEIQLNQEKWESELRSIRALEKNFEILTFNAKSAEISAEFFNKLRFQGNQVEIIDCMIAGTMKAHGVTKIITANIKHFDRFSGFEPINF